MRKSRLSQFKQDRLIEHFVAGSTARTAAALIGVNFKSAAYYFRRLRELIALELERESTEVFDGEIEVDESYFGGRRKGQRGRAAAGKVPVFGLLKRGGKVYTKIIPDASSRTLYPIIERKVVPDSIVYSDSWRGYNVLDVSDFKHFRINHSQLFADKKNHINGIENFWNQAKRHMRKFNGVPKEHFGLFLKECEWRFNNSDPSFQLKQLKQWVKNHMG
ncbi:MAG: IS1595 family transposase [Alphaproteobacteria bacterium]|nr:IS1595 family transposase [Alphaproteobacteria bacterium]